MNPRVRCIARGVDNLHGSAALTLFDRLKFAFDYIQDTWSGATPIATAPLVLRGNRPTSPDGFFGATPSINCSVLNAGCRRAIGVIVGTFTGIEQIVAGLAPERPQEHAI